MFLNSLLISSETSPMKDESKDANIKKIVKELKGINHELLLHNNC